MTADNTQKVTIYSVARRAGVSTATVSRVIQRPGSVSPARRERVERAISELNYVPLGAARSLAVRSHESHGLVLPELTGPYYSDLLMGYEERASELGQSVVLLVRAPGAAAVAGTYSDRIRHLVTRVDGLVVLGSADVEPELLSELASIKPMVMVAGSRVPGAAHLQAENVWGARELTQHLLNHQRRRLLFVGDPDQSFDGHARYQGFVQAMREAGLEPGPPVRVSYLEQCGQGVARDLARARERPQGLVCVNDEVALAVIQTLRPLGIQVPKDLAVVGWDDVMASRYITPGLTTVRQPVQELGVRAAQMLHQLIAGATSPPPESLPCNIIVRQSCGCPDSL